MKIFKWCPEIAIKVCQHWWPEAHAHICVRSPGREAVIPACDGPAIFLAFHDLGANADPKYRDGLFTEAHAQTIVDFVKQVDENRSIVVNCEGGISRSSGIVLAMRRHYGGDTEELFEKAVPNIHVTSLISRILNVGIQD